MKKLILGALLLASPFFGSAQLIGTGSPVKLSANQASIVKAQQFIVSADVLSRYQKEDLLNDKFKNKPFRFGVNLEADISTFNSGTWFEEEGKSVWQTAISSPGALSLNYFFSEFQLPASAQLFIINADNGAYFGPIGADNNSDLNNLSTWPFEGDRHMLQVVVNSNQKKLIKLQISQVTHAYRGLKANQGVGDSDPCNINAICPEASAWTNQRNADVIIIAGGSGMCSGTLVNNTLNNGRPFILTAEHCGINVNAWSFRFNFQSSDCATNQISGPAQTVSGAKSRAHNGESDFSLLEMNTKPPVGYNAYYAGWDRTDNIPTSQIAFHHPSGDLKKYSKNDNDGVKGFYMDGSSGVKTWKIDAWERGTTEGGSSGCGLYDQNGRIIGQLLGGEASCTNTNKSDYFGRLAVSFKTTTDSAKTLTYWLDPGYTGKQILDGLSSTSSSLAIDVALAGITGVDPIVCGKSITPSIKVVNNGTTTLNSFKVSVQIVGGSTFEMPWQGALTSGQFTIVNFQEINLPNGQSDLIFKVIDPNNQTDERTDNNEGYISTTINSNGRLHSVDVTLDQFGSENEWRVTDSNNNILATGGPYADGTSGMKISDKVCLETGCYKLLFIDGYGDGMCCAFGNGSYRFISFYGDTLVTGWRTPPGPDGVEVTETSSFCVTISSINETDKTNFEVFPNPAKDIINIRFEKAGTYQLELVDVSGKLITTSVITGTQGSIKTSQVESGLYFLKVTKDNQTSVSKVHIW